jgi:hypothetical protein
MSDQASSSRAVSETLDVLASLAVERDLDQLRARLDQLTAAAPGIPAGTGSMLDQLDRYEPEKGSSQ